MHLIQDRVATYDLWQGPLGDKSQGRLNFQGQSFGLSRGRKMGLGRRQPLPSFCHGNLMGEGLCFFLY